MKIPLFMLALAACHFNAQQSRPYYPHTRNLIFQNKDQSHNRFVYEKSRMVTELFKITEKVFYSTTLANYSNTGTSLTQRLDLIPLRQNNENIFSTGITLQLLGDKETHIGVYYTEDFKNEDYQQQKENNFSYMQSVITMDKPDKIALSFPMQMLNSFIKDPAQTTEFFIKELKTVISKDKKVTFTAEGKFNKAFYLKNTGTNSLIIKNIVFELVNDEVVVKAVDPTFYDMTTEYPRTIIISKTPFEL